MDRYFSLVKEEITPEKLHLIGVTCIFMASKYEDIYPFKL